MTGGRDRSGDDICIVMAGIGADYQDAVGSTNAHCERYAPEAWRLCYRELPIDCPEHSPFVSRGMYAFKIFAMARAIDAGFRYILWMDTSFQPISGLAKLWSRIRADGFYIPQQQNAKLGEWCSDRFFRQNFLNLQPEDFEVVRTDLMKVPLVYSGLVGLDMEHPHGTAIWRRWNRSWGENTWNGPHLNSPLSDPDGEAPGQSQVDGVWYQPWGLKWRGLCSHDKRVSGHRHDEAALSLVLHQLGLTPHDTSFLTISNPEDGIIGHHCKLVVPHADYSLRSPSVRSAKLDLSRVASRTF